MNQSHIAPCGMNCSLCIAYQGKKYDIKKKGINRKYCDGCRPRGENCLHMAKVCEKVGKGQIEFCFECEAFPCKRLKALDKRYRTKYHMSMIGNLRVIQELGMNEFLKSEEAKWACQTCGGLICCHNGLCLNCSIETLLENRAYRWGEQEIAKR